MTANSAENQIGHYIDNGDGTVTDTRTGLTWMRCALGQTWDGSTCVGVAGEHPLTRVVSLRINFAGSENWRVPTIDELETLVDPTRTMPCIDVDAFPNFPPSTAVFWSSSHQTSNQDFANWIRFDIGTLCDHAIISNSNHVRLVLIDEHNGVGTHDSKTQPTPKVVAQDKNNLASENLNNIDRFEYFIKKVEGIESKIDTLVDLINSTSISIKSSQLAATKHISKQVDLRVGEYEGLINRDFDELKNIVAESNKHTNSAPPTNENTSNSASKKTTTTEGGISTILAKLAKQDQIKIAELRNLLLPLDLMTSAVIDEVNERALDLTGEPALIEDGDNVIVQREVLLQIITC